MNIYQAFLPHRDHYIFAFTEVHVNVMGDVTSGHALRAVPSVTFLYGEICDPSHATVTVSDSQLQRLEAFSFACSSHRPCKLLSCQHWWSQGLTSHHKTSLVQRRGGCFGDLLCLTVDGCEQKGTNHSRRGCSCAIPFVAAGSFSGTIILTISH